MPDAPSVPPITFDRPLLKARQARWPHASDFVTELVTADLGDRLAPVVRPFETALVMGPDAQRLPETLVAGGRTVTPERLSTLAGPDPLDPDALTLPRTDYELIVSLLDLQSVNDVPGFLARIHAHLAPDGLFIAAALGGQSLTELRQAWLAADAEIWGGAAPRVAPMIDVRDAGALLQRAGFALPVADLESHVVRYASPLEMMQDVRRLGAANPLAERAPRPVTPALLAKAHELYAQGFSDPDGRVRATLEILWLSGWSPHESQQKPLAPGSAQVSLTRVLGDRQSH